MKKLIFSLVAVLFVLTAYAFAGLQPNQEEEPIPMPPTSGNVWLNPQ